MVIKKKKNQKEKNRHDQKADKMNVLISKQAEKHFKNDTQHERT